MDRELFRPIAADTGELELNADSDGTDEDTLEKFKFVGKCIAKAIYDRQNLVLPMAPVFYKILRGLPCGLDDLEVIDPAMHKSLQWMLDNSVEGVLFEKFSVAQMINGQEEEVALCEGGLSMEVTVLKILYNFQFAQHFSVRTMYFTPYPQECVLNFMIKIFK